MRRITIVATSSPWAELGELLAGPNLQVSILTQAEIAFSPHIIRAADLFAIDLHDIDGAAFIEAAKAVKPHVPVLAASRPDHPGRLAALEAGAVGLLRSPIDKLEMVSAIYSVLRSPPPDALLAADILGQMPAKVALLDESGDPLYLNPAAAEFWQIGSGESFGSLYPHDLAQLSAAGQPAVFDSGALDDAALAGARATPVPHKLLKGRLTGIAGKSAARVVLAFEQVITGDHLAPAQLRGQDFRTLHSEIEAFLSVGASQNAFCALHLLHVGGLASINQNYGLFVGDHVMQVLQTRLTGIESIDGLQVARIAGDEYAVMHHIPGPDALPLAAADLMSVANTPVLFAGERLIPRLRLGAALAKPLKDDADDLQRAAARALLNARAQGHDGAIVTVAAEHMGQAGGAKHDLPVVSSLALAIEADALDLRYQPMIDLASGRWTALETLVRWPRADRGDVPPRDILAIAKDESVLEELTAWTAARMACDDFRMAQGDLPRLRFILHLSWEQMMLPDLPSMLTVLEPLAREGRIELMLPPAVFDEAPAAAVIETLGRRGFICAVRLSRSEPELPENLAAAGRVKIDAPDISLLNRQILRARLKRLGIIGGNVEEATQLVSLREQGFEIAQGFYIQPPLELTALIALFRAGEP